MTPDGGEQRAHLPLAPSELFEAVLRAATEHAIIATDEEGTIVLFNAGAERLLGYLAEEVVGRATPRLFHDAAELAAVAAEVGRTGPTAAGFHGPTAPETREWTYLRKDGTRVPVSVTVSAIANGDGVVRGWVSIARDLTAERAALEERARSDDQLLRVLEALPLPVLITRAEDGKVEVANSAFESAFGWAPPELVGQTAEELQLWGGMDGDQLARRTASGALIGEQEVAVRTRFGTVRHTHVAAGALDVGGEPCIVKIFSDVTERHALDEALRESEERLRAIIDAAPAVIVLRDLEGRHVLVNRWFEESFGLAAAQVIGRPPEALYPREIATSLRRLDDQVRRQGSPMTVEQVLPHADGTDHTYLTLKFPLRTTTGEIYAICSILTDVTDMELVEEALRQSEERFRQLAESIDEVFVLMVYDPLEVLYVNSAFDRIIGYDRRRFVADPSTFLGWIDARERDAVAQAAVAATARGEEFELEYRLATTQGPERWVRSRLRPIDDGAAHGRWVVSIADITLQKSAELAMRRALVEAERANRAKSEFLSRMSHELRTPLNAILGFGQLLELDEVDAERAESVGQILKAGRHLLALINEILEISRIESGQLRLSLEPVDVASLVSEALDMFRPLTAERSLSLSGPVDPGTWGWVLADHQRLKQVLLNLLSNAVKYNRAGGSVQVDVDLTNTEVALLTVRDTGIGIPVEDVDRVFVPFDRLGAESSGEEGTGLGLTLSKGLVEAMGGAIGVTSQVGSGTTFWLELRRIGAPAPEAAAEAERRLHPEGPVARRTVLYVEDNLSNVVLVERLLARRPGVQLITAMQGGLALELAAQHVPDLVLLDLNLPDVSGEEVLRRLQADPATAATPVVIISADALPRQVSRLLSLGATDYLTKPIDLDRFYAVVDGVLGH